MTNKLLSVFGALGMVLGLLAATTQGCGGSSSSVAETCNKVCDKEGSCNPQFASFVSQCKTSCANPGGSSGSNNPTNCPGLTQDQAIAKANDCLAMSCDTFESCLLGICGNSTGSAGSNGSGSAGSNGSGNAGSTGHAGSGGGAGSSGSAGAGGGDCTATCAKAQICCMGLATKTGNDPSQCMFNDPSLCSGANASQAAQSCQSVITSSAPLGIAGCN